MPLQSEVASAELHSAFARSAQTVSAAPTKGMNLLAIEIGGTKLQICTGNEHGELVARRRFTVDGEAGGAGIRAQIAAALPELLAEWQPAAIGVGYGGPVDWKTGVIRCSHQVPGWENFPLAEWLRAQAGVPVFVENDANAAALGEALHGAGRGASPMVYMNSGSGVGGGLVLEGRLYHGAVPGEMEMGHLWVDQYRTNAEELCSGWATDACIRELIADEPESPLARLVQSTPGGCEAKHLAQAIAEECPVATRVCSRVANDIAYTMSHAAHLLHPEVIVFGGGLSLIGEPLRSRIAAALATWVMPAFAPGPRVLLAALREDSVPVGALALAAQRLAPGTQA